MRILYITLVDISQPTGPGTNELESVEALASYASEDVQISFLLPKSTSKYMGSVKNILYFNVEEKIFPFISIIVWQIQYLRSFKKFFKQIYSNRKELIVVIRPDMGGKLGFIPLWLNLKGVKYAFRHYQDQAIKTSFYQIKKWYKYQVLKWGLSKASCIDASQKAGKDQLNAMGYQNVQVIGNAVNLNRFKLMDIKDAREIVGLSKNSFIIGYIGGLPLERGAGLMIKSAKSIISKIPNVHFLIIGDSKYKSDSHMDRMKIELNSLNLMKYFTFTGIISYDKVLPYFNSLNVGVALVSTAEVKRKGNSSQKIYQYLACGTPVIIPNNTHQDLVDSDVAT